MADEHTLKGKINNYVVSKAIHILTHIPTDETYTIDIRKFKKDRSAAQRRLQHVWYTHIFQNQPGAEDEQYSKKYIENYCKLSFGVPILIRDSEEFAVAWSVMSSNMTYQEQIEAMAFLQVTRLFKVKQNTEYLEEMKRHYAELEDDPIFLPTSEDLYYEAMGYTR